MTTPIIIDTDPGIDDAMAIYYALAEPEIDLLALTTVFGNVTGPEAARNARALLEVAGVSIPVAAGAGRPLVRAPPPHPYHVHGRSGLGGLSLPEPTRAVAPEPAPALLARLCAERPGKITIVALGPLTNLAVALETHPEIAQHAGRVVVMGGAVRRRGNITPHAEANLWQDPHAAARVLAAGWPMTLVGLDVTTTVILAPERLAGVAALAPRCGRALVQAAEVYFRFHAEALGLEGCHFHDPTAVMAAVEMAHLTTQEIGIEVVLDGPEIGRTREAPSARPVSVCLKAAAEPILARFVGAFGSGALP